MHKPIDLTGKKFGRLEVIELSHVARKNYKNSKKNIYYWACKCDCGNMKYVDGSNLLSGRCRSCGCLKKGIKLNPKFNSGKTFFQKNQIQLKYKYNQGGKIKKYKLSSAELTEYLKSLEYKEVQYVGTR